MNHAQNTKVVQIVPPQAIVDNASWTPTIIDTLGFEHCQIIVQLGATDIAMAALKVQESDDDAAADAYADVTGLVVGTSANIAGATSALPSATDDNKFMIFDINCMKRERYLKLVATAGDGSAGTFISALAILSRPKQGVATAAQRGADEILRV